MHCLVWRPDEHRLWRDEKGRPTAVTDVTIRTNLGRMSLTPTKRNNALIVGVLGRASERYDFETYSIAVMSNHVHYQIGVRSAEHEAQIKCFLHGNIARELGGHGHYGPQKDRRTLRLRGRLWGRRGRGIPILDDASLLQRFRYILANGTKEGLVAHPVQMPGVHAAKPLCRGDRTLYGVWYDRSSLDAVRRRNGQSVPEREVAQPYAVRLAKLPPLRHLTDDQYARFCREMCDDIAQQARDALQKAHGVGFRPMGPKKLKAVHPLTLPEAFDRKPAPLVHVSGRASRRAFRSAYASFVEAYQLANLHLRNAIRDRRLTRIEFPHGGIPPAGLLRA